MCQAVLFSDKAILQIESLGILITYDRGSPVIAYLVAPYLGYCSKFCSTVHGVQYKGRSTARDSRSLGTVPRCLGSHLS